MPLSFESLRLDHAHLLADPVEHTKTVELANARALELGLVHLPQPVLARAAQSRVSLSQWQTGFRDQLDRSSCYAFAACAAMEAAYRRQFGLVVNLSEHYVFHINKVTALLNDWVNSPSSIENNSTLIGFQGSSDMVDKLARFAVPDEDDAAYLTQAQMVAIRDTMPAAGNMMTQPQNDAFEFDNQILPMVAHQRGRYQVETFAALPDRPSVDQLKQVLQAGFEVVADIKEHCSSSSATTTPCGSSRSRTAGMRMHSSSTPTTIRSSAAGTSQKFGPSANHRPKRPGWATGSWTTTVGVVSL
jgi:hypothetical protein